MASLRLLVLPLCFAAPAVAQTAQEIMARVALNQDAAEADRLHYLYVQHARVRSLKGKTVRCEEITDARIVPTEKGSSEQLLKLNGRLLQKGQYVTYDERSVRPPRASAAVPAESPQKERDELTLTADVEDTMDRDLVENMRSNLTRNKSKDGVSERLFPLTTGAQANYDYVLVGRAPLNGHETFHITFTPKVKNEFGWKGDAYVDTTAYQPVLVRTTMAKKVPFAVRTLLGTNVPGLGFTVGYEPAAGKADAPWFPVTFGTEFKLHVLFFLNRDIVVEARNSDFEKTHVTSVIVPAAETH